MSNSAVVKERVEHAVNLNAALLERSGYSEEAYARVVLNAMVQSPSIAECDQGSLHQALLAAMNAGLVPDGKESAIVPYNKKATLILMIEGRLKLAQQATKGLIVRSMAVYDGDEFGYAEGLNPRLDHTPNPAASNAEQDLTYVYATARLPGASEPQYDVMSRATVDRYRAFSASPTRGPWATHFEEMAKNAVLKRLLKRLPKSSRAPVEAPELERFDTLEDALTLGETPSGQPVDKATGEILEAEKAEPKPAPSPSANGARAGRRAGSAKEPIRQVITNPSAPRQAPAKVPDREPEPEDEPEPEPEPVFTGFSEDEPEDDSEKDKKAPF